MAAANSESDRQVTVLRVKRKRTDDHFNALIVHQSSAKKKKCDESANKELAEDEANNNSLFRFAGTVTEDEIKSTSDVVNNIRQADLSHQTDFQRIKSRLRSVQREKQQLSRYRVLSQRRQDCLDSDDTKELGPSTPEDREVERIFQIFDVMVDDVEKAAKLDKRHNNSRNSLLEDDIMCNSARMIRDKLNIADQIRGKDPEYVYDLYFAPDLSLSNVNDILDIEPYSQDLIIEPFQNDTERMTFEEDDDENDEDNWRNDYPDEDEYNSSASEKQYHEEYRNYYSSGEEDYYYDRFDRNQHRSSSNPVLSMYGPDSYSFEVVDESGDDDDGP